MKTRTGFALATFTLAAALGGGSAMAQGTAQLKNISYDLARETAMSGTILKFEAASSVAPLGAQVTVETGGGVVEVHLGGAQFLKLNHFTLAEGDSVRIIGEEISVGTRSVFAARVIQKGGQTLAVRNLKGALLERAGARMPAMRATTQSNGGAL
jgi:hypothetical protein